MYTLLQFSLRVFTICEKISFLKCLSVVKWWVSAFFICQIVACNFRSEKMIKWMLFLM